MMSALNEALAHAATGGPRFPCRETEPGRKRPYTARGFLDASCDPSRIERWWRQWPNALVGMPTGAASGLVVLDIDVKDPTANGFDSLEDLGIVLPETPTVHTASGGLHLYFTNPTHRELRCSAGLLGAGLDIRANGGYVIVPSEGSGYVWDPISNLDSVAPPPAPAWLWPVQPRRPIATGPVPISAGLSPYGEAAINAACDAIYRAARGEQEKTLNAEAFSIGTLAGAGAVPGDLALRALLKAAAAMPDYDSTYPWRPEELDFKVRRAFNAGTARPREVQPCRRTG
jgi:Bifunctional DNA primase/polymerase, N-terminal